MGVSNVAAQRMAEAAGRVNARLLEITEQTGISFPLLFEQRTTALASAEAAAEPVVVPDADAAVAEAPLPADPVPEADMQSALSSTAPDSVSGAEVASVPLTLDEMFSSVASTYGLNPDLLKAVAQARSGMDAGAVSASGALGLMQLDPTTVEGLGIEDADSVLSNLDGGARSLMAQIIRYNGNMDMALAASEIGPAEMRRLGVTDPSLFYLLPEDVRQRVAEVRRILTENGQAGLLDQNFFE